MVAGLTHLEAELGNLGAEIAGRAKANEVARSLMKVPEIRPLIASAIERFLHLMSYQSLSEAVSQTVMQGGDTDTNAAICGALIGAVEGRAALPLAWQSQILGCRAVPLPHVVHPRPSTYWADDALELAEALIMPG